MVVLTLINILLGIAALIYWFLHRRLQYWKNKNVPHIEPEFFYGNSRGLGKTFGANDFVRKMYTKLKSKSPIAGIYIYIQPQALVTNLDLIRDISVKDFHVFTNRGLYFNEADDPLSANLAALEDETWKNLRQKITPTFTSGKLKVMYGAISEISDRLVNTIETEMTDTGNLEIKVVLSRFTTDVIGSVAFGIECNSLEDPTTKFYEMGLRAFSNLTFLKRMLLGIHQKLANRLHITKYVKEVSDFYLDVVQKTINYRKENPQLQRNDYLNLLLNLKGDDALTFNQTASQCVVFLTAGFETTATSLTYCLYELSLNEEIQKKARHSVEEVLKQYGSDPTYDLVNNEMGYLEQCINESLRKYPPVQATSRVANADYQVPNTNIVLDKGTFVMLPVSGIHWDPEIYPDPEKYDPVRFSPQEIKKRHPYAFMPFGEGPRQCIGMRFAIVEMKIALAKILLNYEFTLDRTKTSVPLVYELNRVIMTPKEGIFINFRKF